MRLEVHRLLFQPQANYCDGDERGKTIPFELVVLSGSEDGFRNSNTRRRTKLLMFANSVTIWMALDAMNWKQILAARIYQLKRPRPIDGDIMILLAPLTLTPTLLLNNSTIILRARAARLASLPFVALSLSFFLSS